MRSSGHPAAQPAQKSRVLRIGTGPGAAVQALEAGHVLLIQLEVEDTAVLQDALAVHGLGNGHHVELQVPADSLLGLLSLI
ncbi:MAG: hypothetical protein JW820_13210 [Spirochaetales bacterium]|nr:hypothetical protein [Spirochaetales bacterium]